MLPYSKCPLLSWLCVSVFQFVFIVDEKVTSGVVLVVIKDNNLRV
jgi:hypothetical protein